MAPTETTTLRVPRALRDEIARMADERGDTMLDVVTDAIERLRREEWWATVHRSVEDMTAAEITAYRGDANELDRSAGDGLGAH